MENKLSGSCYCGSIHFELKKKPKLVVNCHCDECKKRNGSVFSTYLAVSEKDLLLTQGEDKLKQYEKADEGIKYFCADCGSPVYNKNYRYPGLYMVFYGVLGNPANFTPAFNVFCESKHDWVDSIGSLKSFPAGIER